MDALFKFPVDLSRTAAALEGIHSCLSRIANALERLSPEVQPHPDPYKAGLQDLRRTDQSTIHQVQEELAVFAANANVAINSEAFIRAIIEYERNIAEVYGKEAILELPWNKAAGGSLFEDQFYPQTGGPGRVGGDREQTPAEAKEAGRGSGPDAGQTRRRSDVKHGLDQT
jgi:hypothetical protein